MSDLYTKDSNTGSGLPSKQIETRTTKATFVPSTLGSYKDKQHFSRVLSQVKLLEHSGTNKLIKTLREQAKALKVSRKKILQSSCSMTDY